VKLQFSIWGNQNLEEVKGVASLTLIKTFASLSANIFIQQPFTKQQLGIQGAWSAHINRNDSSRE